MLGFKAGLEIHQRLATSRKLFCRCPAAVGEEEPHGTLTRKIRAVAGELGHVDPAAAFEAARGKTFHYQLFPSSSCLVEQDEEPPTELNSEALEIVLQVSKALGARVLDEVHVMRKTVADGSAVSAFQRTALVAVDGKLETSQGFVGIATVCLEEESAGIVEKTLGQSTYRLDRLGIPLIEIATDATLKNGAHAREVAEKVGGLLRSTGRVQRGIGSIRQDLNVSIAGGARVEIKGAQELRDVADLVDFEAKRQQSLVGLHASVRRRGFLGLAFSRPVDVSNVFAGAKPFFSKPLQEGAVALAVKFMHLGGLLGQELIPDLRFGSEVSDYAKAKTGVKGIVHSDEDPSKYGLTSADFDTISLALDCGSNDAWAAVVAPENVAVPALKAAFDRAYLLEVPKETRRAEGTGSRFMRPLPGAARMYPETDVVPVPVAGRMLSKIPLPKSLDERKADYVKLGLNTELAEKMVHSYDWPLFDQLCRQADPKTVAWVLLDVKPQLRRQGVNVEMPDSRWKDVLALYAAGDVTRAALPDVVQFAVQNPAAALADGVREKKLQRVTGKPLEVLAAFLNHDFGQIMRLHRLTVDASELRTLLASKRP
ncbi:Glu-tRNA(Gln) amidotransferase subunit GatE [Candidatus Micrarchaeota archaeon]|nr:Glu-tRNA(Gln) amidotransferase subunit GatE [Candidatus Micrarchaeota archaeon]